jgi:Zn-dependent protease with chaperone function
VKKKNKVGFLKRVGNYGSRRVLPDAMASNAKSNAKSSIAAAIDALRPNAVDPDELRSGYIGRYADGGRARFEKMVAKSGLDGGQLDMMAKHNRKLFILFLMSGLAGLAMGFYMMFTEEIMVMILSGAAVCIVGLTMIATAVRYEFICWQITNRRFGGFREFLDQKL